MQIDGGAAMIRHFEYLFLGKRLMQGDLTHRTGAGEPNRPPARDIEQPLVPLEATIQQVRMLCMQQLRVMGVQGCHTLAQAHLSCRMARHDVGLPVHPGTVG